MNYIISDNTRSKKLEVECIKNGSYTVLSVQYTDETKIEMLKYVLDFVSKLNK